MKTQLRLKLFGIPQFTYQGTPLTGFSTNKARALLIYLAVTGRPHSRDALAHLLWADKPATSRGNLKKALSNLRKLEGVSLIEEGWHRVSLTLDHCWSDVAEFEQLAGEAKGPLSATAQTNLQSAVELHQDDFLAGFNTSLSHEFEEWALGEQTRLRVEMVDLLRQLAAKQTQQNERPQAIATLRRLLRFEPWQEEIHRQLIELLAGNNDAAAALAHFEECREDLRRELDVDPSPATLKLIAQIRDGTFHAIQPSPSISPQRTNRPVEQKQAKTTVDYPLVGRSGEWRVIHEKWQTLDSSHFICIGGEAGIGKTRLAEELLMQAEAEGTLVARARSHQLQGQLAYGPVTDWLRTPPLQSALAQLEDGWRTEVARLLPELLAEGLTPPQPLKEGWQRKRFFDALSHAFTAVDGPLLLVLDDLQWSDTDTLEWIQYLLESSNAPILVVGTVRLNEIDAAHPLQRVWQHLRRQDKLTEVLLSELSVGATNQLAATVGEARLEDTMAQRLFTDTAGNPLFVIESMRVGSMDNATTGAHFSPYPQAEQVSNALPMPAKMYNVIQSRLGQLSPQAQQLAQLGAAIGRAFDVALLATAADSDENVVLILLDELWQHRIIKEVSAAYFDFSHDRIRDVAYAEIGPIKRRILHKSVADALGKIHDSNSAAVAGQLAVHYESAGSMEQAMSFYQQAADEAGRLFAYQDAVQNREKALSLHRQKPKSRETLQVEIELLLAVIKDRTIADGKGAPTIEPFLTKAHALAQDVGTDLQKILVLNAITVDARVRGEWYRAFDLAYQTLAASEALSDPARINYARFGTASAHMRRGNIEEAYIQMEQVLENSGNEYPDKIGGYLNRSAYCLWLFGYPDQARKRGLAAVAYRNITGVNEEIPLHHCSSVHVFCGDVQVVDELSAELVELTTRRGDDFSLRWGLIYRGWILIQQGHLEEGIALVSENANEHRDRGNYFYECIWRSLLAEAYILSGEIDAAFREIDETLAYAEKSGDVHWNAQLLKQRGDCLQACGASELEVERAYQHAIETARSQTSRSLELRATTSLCRLWKRQGKVDEAHQLLSQIYGWFTEGFETADLVEAKTLLDELRLPVLAGDGEKEYA